MSLRRAIVAGQFYPGRHDTCIAEIEEYIHGAKLPSSLPDSIVCGIVPHAGWTFSGQLAALVFCAVKQRHEKVDTFIVFGAAHGFFDSAAAVFSSGTWQSPLGQITIDEHLTEKILKNSRAVANDSAHSSEHSIEVQVPFIQYLFPDAKLLPIIVPPSKNAIGLGQAIGDVISSEKNKKIVCIGSTDLTHYGPRYGFEPMGVGEEACRWASEVNDKKFIDSALNLDAQAILTTAAENANAGGPGAAAAAVSAAKKLGKTRGLLLAHTNSNDVMKSQMGITSQESVGYAAIIF